MWAGPLPSPEALEKFGEIVPNGAERVIRMAEAEQAHRFEADHADSESQKRILEENVANTKREQRAAMYGLWLGWSLSAGSIAAALASVYIGAHWSVSAALVGVPLMSVVRTLVLRK
jgi:uncharacterized membrane protein